MTWGEMSNRALAIQRDTFGDPIEYRGSVGDPLQISAVFLEKYIEIDPGTRSKVASTSPVFHVVLTDIPNGPEQNDLIIHNSTTYMVRSVEPDGEGSAILKVRKCTSVQ